MSDTPIEPTVETPIEETPVTVDEPTVEEAKQLTPEEIEEKDKQEFIAQNSQQMKAVKAFCSMIASLPDHLFPLDDKTLDEVFEPRTRELYNTLKRDKVTYRQLEDGINRLLALIADQTIVRCRNFTDVMFKQLMHELLGYYEPHKEMPLGELENVLQSIQQENGQSKETNTWGDGTVQE